MNGYEKSNSPFTLFTACNDSQLITNAIVSTIMPNAAFYATHYNCKHFVCTFNQNSNAIKKSKDDHWLVVVH